MVLASYWSHFIATVKVGGIINYERWKLFGCDKFSSQTQANLFKSAQLVSCWRMKYLSGRWPSDTHLFLFASSVLSFFTCSSFRISLTSSESPSISFSIFLAVSLWPVSLLTPASQTSACRDFLHLQHTWGIKEGWNSLICGWSEKKEGPRSAQHFIYGTMRSFNETWVLMRECLISFWPTSEPRKHCIRNLCLSSFICHSSQRRKHSSTEASGNKTHCWEELIEISQTMQATARRPAVNLSQVQPW